MSASGMDWEAVLARMTRARHKVEAARLRIQAAIAKVCDGELDKEILREVQIARRELDMACGLLGELTRVQL